MRTVILVVVLMLLLLLLLVWVPASHGVQPPPVAFMCVPGRQAVGAAVGDEVGLPVGLWLGAAVGDAVSSHAVPPGLWFENLPDWHELHDVLPTTTTPITSDSHNDKPG